MVCRLIPIVIEDSGQGRSAPFDYLFPSAFERRDPFFLESPSPREVSGNRVVAQLLFLEAEGIPTKDILPLRQFTGLDLSTTFSVFFEHQCSTSRLLMFRLYVSDFGGQHGGLFCLNAGARRQSRSKPCTLPDLIHQPLGWWPRPRPATSAFQAMKNSLPSKTKLKREAWQLATGQNRLHGSRQDTDVTSSCHRKEAVTFTGTDSEQGDLSVARSGQSS